LNAVFDRTANLVGHMLASPAFRECVDIRMRAQYMDCGDDYTAIDIDDAIAAVFAALENGNHYRWACHNDPGEDMGGLSAGVGRYRDDVEKVLMINVGATWREDFFSWFAPPYRVWPWNFTVDGTIHEYLHQHGYIHTDDQAGCARAHGRTADQAGYYLHDEPSVPYIVGSCAHDVMSLSGLLGPIEGPAAACARDEIRLVASWPRGGGPASVASYTFCSSDDDCSGGARCALSYAEDPRGICGTCLADADCRGLGSTSRCLAGWCRDSRIIIPTTCVPNLRREVTMHSLATNQPVRYHVSNGTSATYLAANAPGRNRFHTSFWLTDLDRGQLLSGDTIHLKTSADTWVGLSGTGYLRDNRESPYPFTIRGSGSIGAGSWFWLEGAGSVVEAVTDTTPFLRTTTVASSSRRFFRFDRPSRKLVYLASPFWNRWTEAVDGGLRSLASPTTLAAPRRASAFWMIDHDGGKLASGNTVSFQPLDDSHWWSTATNGEGQVLTDRYWSSTQETFQIVCVTCADTDDVKHGDVVAVRANGTGKFLTHMPYAPGEWYPYQVHAGGDAVGSWQHTQIVEVSQYRNPTRPLDEVTRTTWTME
jgi:hypothetical protein